jgi:UDP-N-acetyl-alpha-D-muramoyl-L-alanyl-L-glutamate epimerase
LVVRRRLSPELGVLNRAGALNGHVPITALISLMAVVGSFLYGYDAIVMAIERSASEETVVVDGVPVNHQYSKSLDFEALLQGLVSGFIDPDLRYGSALRPYSELAIARAFARLTGYHTTFCSCNTVFRQAAGAEDGWCGNCPKCRFVGLMLAPFLTPDAVQSIVGRDLFADPDQIPGFAALMSDDDKPFECVGERRESAAAMRILSELPGWKDTTVVASLGARARAMVSDDEVRTLLMAQPGLGFARPDVADAVERVMTAAG